MLRTGTTSISQLTAEERPTANGRKRSGAHHLVVMNSTSSTLMEVEQIKRQSRGRPQSEAKARTKVSETV
jgi:starvation-inducible outer membrane lipoprotein